MRKILIFGDSLTAGYGLASPTTESFPALIQKKIKEAHLAYTVVNAGLSGDTSSGGLSRLEYWISTPIDIFILELGINDIIRGLPTSSTYHNLDSILNRVRKKHPQCKIAIMGMEIPSSITSTRIEEFRAIFRKLADLHQATFVPFFLEGVMGIKNLNLGDGLHPSSKGYEIIADRVWPILEKMLEE